MGTYLSLPGPTRLEKYDEIVDADGLGLDGDDVGLKERRKKNGLPGEAPIIPALFQREGHKSSLWVLDLYAPTSVGILVSYFCIGVISKLTQTPVQYYLIEYLNASSTQYSVYNTLHRLPWSLKFFFGVISDGLPILSYRRKPWLIIGYSGFMAVNFYLMWIGTPGINQTIFLVFTFTCFYVLADVCTDTLTVERSFYEHDSKRGAIQSVGFIYRSFGKVLGSVMGTFLYDNGTAWSFDIDQIFMLNALIPMICMTFVLWGLVELASLKAIPSTAEQMKEVWHVLQLRAVWRPMIFIYIFAVMQIPNSAWSNFLVWGLGFSDAYLGYLTITSSIVGCLGYVSFKAFFFRTSWHRLYIGSGIVSFLFSVLQICLILRVNTWFGVPDIVFAVGDDAIVALMESLHAMPSVIMFVMLCPQGAEGSTFALLTTMASLAGTVASDFGSALTGIWDVSNETLAAGDFSGILKLTVLTSLLQLSPLVLIGFFPDTREEHQAAVGQGRHSWWCGLILAVTVVLSLVFTVLLNFYLLY